MSIVIWLIILQYFFCPQYDFKKYHSFTGKQFYNPYQDINDSNNWVKSNFHTHTKCWWGITNGYGSAAEFKEKYDSLNYGVLGVSNYQNNNSSYSSLPVYEHGYNLKKTHQLVVGNSKITWLDYIFPQTLSNKQQLLTQLGEPDNVVILAHPALRNAYAEEDVKLLSGYQCMEIMSPAKQSLPQWDAALSAGKVVFAVSNDDIHSIYDTLRFSKYCTWLYLPGQRSQQSIIAALKEGRGYAMKIGIPDNEGEQQRKERIRSNLPFLRYCKLSGDTLLVKFSTAAKQIQFTGDNGDILSVIQTTDTSFYKIKAGNSYVRVSAFFGDGTEIYLNPVFRINGEVYNRGSSFSINKFRTSIFCFIGVTILLSWCLFLLKLFKFPLWKRYNVEKKSFALQTDPGSTK